MESGRRRAARAPPPQPDDLGAARMTALHILNGAAQSAASLTRRLVRDGFTAETAATAVTEMSGYGYVDDVALATSIVRRRREAGYGTAWITADLRNRGLSAVAIETALTPASRDEEFARAGDLARRSWRLGDDAESAALDRERRRIAGLLQRRGFGGDVISSVLRAMESARTAD